MHDDESTNIFLLLSCFLMIIHDNIVIMALLAVWSPTTSAPPPAHRPIDTSGKVKHKERWWKLKVFVLISFCLNYFLND